jgi:hypothetical protein
MFDLKNNNISTFLLLVVLGLLIWHMTKPSKGKETFTNDMVQDKQKIETMENQVTTETQGPTTMPAPTNIQTLEPIISPPVKITTPESTINNFEGYDSADNSNGAEIESAFQAPVPTTNTTVNTVDINKQNIHNYDAKDFLPKEINDQWFDTDFSQAKTNISDDKLINTERYVIGINTVGQSLKNASYDIRGTIANPKFSVSPWNNSTYEPDYNIKPLC